MKKALDFDKQTPVSRLGWTPSFDVPDPADGWSTKLITDDPTLVVRAVRRTRDDNDNGRWKTYYLQVVSKKELKRMRARLKRVIEKSKKEEIRKLGRRVYF
ncbi:MAG TPA: hypothetical protein VNX88_19685 [Terriglobales bacterium]|jgi:hypothetical protein|nr:hypothetical protein [Terriglobales bacterium]